MTPSQPTIARDPAPSPRQATAHLVFVTGPSGAGRTTVLHALEDLGFEVIDNLPLGLLPRLLDGGPPTRPLALCIDPRNRDFTTTALAEAFGLRAADPAMRCDLVYVDCAPETLRRRFSETRRAHPLAPSSDPNDGIALERGMLAPLRALATVIIDTTGLNVHDTRLEVQRHFAVAQNTRMAVEVASFSYRRGIPLAADLVFDARFLRNPHYAEHLREKTGRDAAVRAFVATDPRFDAFWKQIEGMLDLLLPAFAEEGKSNVTICFGCTGGKHRSVSLAELTAQALAEKGWLVSKRHRDLSAPVKNLQHVSETAPDPISQEGHD